ncbi:MAG: 2-oxoacid:acceptor oxidoreductase family protein [Betaproteobacteria bacterium]
MFQVRIHGRGGQGVVTAAEMLSLAAFREGQHAQAFPSFGSERTGAPVMAFARIDGREIRLREPIVSPDAVIVQDRTLLHQVDVFQGLGEQGYVLINSSHTIDELGLADLAARLPAGHFQLLPATQFAMAQLGRPLPGAAMIAGFAALTELISLAAVQAAYRERFSGKVAEANAEVARLAYEHVSASLKESAHA